MTASTSGGTVCTGITVKARDRTPNSEQFQRSSESSPKDRDRSVLRSIVQDRVPRHPPLSATRFCSSSGRAREWAWLCSNKTLLTKFYTTCKPWCRPSLRTECGERVESRSAPRFLC
jgi:hypothetical protein